VQVVDAPEFTLVGLQDRPETRVEEATRLTVVVWEAPLRVALTIAF